VTNSSYGQEAIPFAKDGIRSNVLLPSATKMPMLARCTELLVDGGKVALP
jgi:hypothetical protein